MPTSHENLKEDVKEYTTAEFVREYCNDHNGKIRWLRGIFVDEEEKLQTILEYMQHIESKLDSALLAQREEMVKKIEGLEKIKVVGRDIGTDDFNLKVKGYNSALVDAVVLIKGNDI